MEGEDGLELADLSNKEIDAGDNLDVLAVQDEAQQLLNNSDLSDQEELKD